MIERRTLLLTSHPPGGHGVGQIYIRSLCSLMPAQSAAIAALLAPNELWTPDESQLSLKHIRLSRRYEAVYRPWRGLTGELAAAAGVHVCLRPHARREVQRAAEWGAEIRADRVVAVLDGPATMLMAEPLADKLRVPLHTLVWDVPEHVLPGFGHTSWSARPLRRGFDAALRRSTGVAVMSSAMQRRFEADAGARTTILRQPIDDKWVSGRGSTAPRPTDDFVIGFAGSVTAREEFELLCRALDSMNWSLDGRQVRLRIFGLRFVCQAQSPRWIEYRGYVPETADVVAGLAECDLLFLPQPFGPQGRPFAEYSFPTKFTTYLAAGRPVLILAPAYSALSEFCREHDLPIVCDQPQIGAILSHLRRLACDSGHALDVERRLHAVAQAEFSPQRAGERMAEWLAEASSSVALPVSGRRSASENHAVVSHH